jgi:hypothetical protein
MRKHPVTPIPNNYFFFLIPPTFIEGEVDRMETCEWCEENAVTLSRAIVAGSHRLMCETCFNLFLDSRMGEFVSRRNWEST